MQVTLTFPDALAERILGTHGDASRALLETAAADAYRAGRLGASELRELLGFSRYELDGFLKSRGIWIEVPLEEFESDRAIMERSLALEAPAHKRIA